MLPFTADVLFASFEQYNQALWPLPVIAWVLALGTVLLTVRPMRFSDRVVAALLALAWLWTGYGYHFLHHAALNFAAPIYALFFILGGLLLAWTGVIRGRLAFRLRGDVVGWLGVVLAFAAVVLLPLADWLAGYVRLGVRVVGLTPGPTAVFTLGLLLMTQGRTPLHLLVIPLLWTLVAGATGWILAIDQDIALPVLGLGAFGLVLWKNHRHGAR